MLDNQIVAIDTNTHEMIDDRREQPKAAQLLARHHIGSVYLLDALNSGSEKVFLDALHEIMDAIADELEINLIEERPSTLLD